MPTGPADGDFDRAEEERAPAESPPVESQPVESPDRRATLSRLASRGEQLRAKTAQLSDFIADEAEKFADQLEYMASRGDRERRISTAQVERRIAAIERRNADRLRAAPGRHTPLEPLPDLPGFGPHGDRSTEPPDEGAPSGATE